MPQLAELPDRVSGLRYVTDETPGLRRRKAGKGFTYFDPDGKRITDRDEVERIKKIAIPPAWTDVWISPAPNGHILATGRDAKGRKQYRYHPRWRKVRDEAKFERTLDFAEALPGLRRRLRKDMLMTGLSKEKVVATVVALLDCCFARIGNETYARSNGSFGLTTLRSRHARFDGATLRLKYKGKGGKEHEAHIDDKQIVYIVRKCQEIPGQTLFQYIDDSNDAPVDSENVNDYLRDATGADFTAKDFRTWSATVSCARELGAMGPPEQEQSDQQCVLAAVDAVAEELGNTRTVCRNSYIHPEVIDGYLDGSLLKAWERRSSAGSSTLRGLRAEERFVLLFLRSRARAAKRNGRRSASRAA